MNVEHDRAPAAQTYHEAPSLREPLVITGLGARTPVGLTAAQTYASLRAGVTRFTEWPNFICKPPAQDDDAGEDAPVEEVARVAAAPEISEDASGPERMTSLAVAALQDLLRSTDLKRRALAKTTVEIVLPPEDPPPRSRSRETPWTRAIEAQFGAEVTIRTRKTGPCGLLFALSEASRTLRSSKVETCLIVAVDSYLSYDRLRALDTAWRLSSRRNVDGFIPGEGAIALAVTSPASASGPGLGRLTGLGWGREPAPLTGDKNSTGDGLAAAVDGAMAGQPAARPWVLCDLNQESYRAHELALARVRRPTVLGDIRHLEHPADTLGDLGAARLALFVGAALRSWARGYAPSSTALAIACDDDGARGVIQIDAPSGPK